MDLEFLAAVLDDRAERLEHKALRKPHRRRFAAELERQLTQLDVQRATILVGPRQVGKSVAMAQAFERLRARGWRVWGCDFDDTELRGASLRDVIRAVGEPVEGAPPPVFLFDEIHHVPDWARELKVLVDEERVRFAVADSSSRILQAEHRLWGQGRWRQLLAEPLGFDEWLDFRQALGVPAPVGPVEFARACDTYLRRGGFPEFVRRPGLKEVYELIDRDVVGRAVRDDGRSEHGIRNIDKLERLMVRLLRGSGDRYNAAAHAEEVETTPSTMSRLIRAAMDTGLVWRMDVHSRSPEKVEKRQYKVYACDPVLVARYTPGGRESDDGQLVGRLVETSSAQALRLWARRHEATLGYNEHAPKEKDFLLEVGGRCILLEATAGGGRGHRLVKKARQVARAARRVEELAWAGVVAHVATGQRHEIDGVTVHQVPLHELLVRLGRDETEALGWPSTG